MVRIRQVKREDVVQAKEAMEAARTNLLGLVLASTGKNGDVFTIAESIGADNVDTSRKGGVYFS